MSLLSFMAKACHYAQEHIDDEEAWPTDSDNRLDYLGCVSYQMACFFAQNTAEGSHGVGSDIILDDLIERPMKSEKKWEKILGKIAKELGGWK